MTMMTVRAVYQGGVLRFEQPLKLAEGQAVDVTIATASPDGSVSGSAERRGVGSRRIKDAKSYSEWLKVTELFPEDDGSYDIVKALDENRRLSGERPLLPRDGDES